MTASGTDGDRARRDGHADPTAAERARAPTENFDRSLKELQRSIDAACSAGSSWQANVVAGVRSALEFAGSHPAKAYALTIAARREITAGGNRQSELIEYLAGVLADCAPLKGPASLSTATCLVESVATVVRGRLLAQMAADLPLLAPDIAYLVLLPYVGIEEARQWAAAAETTRGGTSKYDFWP